MSRIGRLPIPVPKGVEVRIENGNQVTVKGPRGQLSRTLHPDMQISQDDGVITVTRPSEIKQHKALHGLTRTLINNMVLGVTTGFSKEMDLVGVGYRAEVQSRKIVFNVGYSHPIEMEIPQGVEMKVERKNKPIQQYQMSLTITASDKEQLGQLAANIRKLRKPEPYKGKGIKYADEVIRRKAGKAGAKK
jgi:large subunit ribosomal protein L6